MCGKLWMQMKEDDIKLTEPLRIARTLVYTEYDSLVRKDDLLIP